MKSCAGLVIFLCVSATVQAQDFKLMGHFLLKAQLKLTGQKVTPVTIKPLMFKVYSDGAQVRVVAEGDEESQTVFDIYRSDGVTRQKNATGAVEIVPGLQATSHADSILRHLRLSRESMTITTFPGVSDQTIISHSEAVEVKSDAAPAAQP
jgi:hypothetical protein